MSAKTEPNWRNPEDYKSLLNAWPEWLAWEFLRRNLDYRNDHTEYRSEVVSWCQAHPDQVFTDPGDGTPPAMLQASSFEFGAEDRWLDWANKFEDKWGMHTPVSPDTGSEAAELFLIMVVDRPEMFKPVRLVGHGDLDGPYVMIPVDLSQPLEKIQRRVMWDIKRLRADGIKKGVIKAETARSQRASLYVQYLRILDADMEGASIQEIGEAIAPDATNDPETQQRDKRIRAQLAAAKKLVSGGYRVLL